MPDEIVLPSKTCKVCGHTWILRKPRSPKWCPGCKSPNWDRTDFMRPSKKRASVRPEIERAFSESLAGA
jgi:hypothetical protein